MDLSFLSQAIPNKATAKSVHTKMCARDASIYELGVFYRAMLSQQLWPSQASLAAFLEVSGAQVSRHVAIARLPIAVVEAFGDPRRISLRIGALLLEAVDKLGEEVVILRAKQAVALKYRAVDDIIEFVVTNRAPTRQTPRVSVSLALDKKTLRVELPNMERLIPHLAKLESFLSTALLMFEANLSSEATTAIKRSAAARRAPRQAGNPATTAQRPPGEK